MGINSGGILNDSREWSHLKQTVLHSIDLI
jgi:hypothetical protein